MKKRTLNIYIFSAVIVTVILTAVQYFLEFNRTKDMSAEIIRDLGLLIITLIGFLLILSEVGLYSDIMFFINRDKAKQKNKNYRFCLIYHVICTTLTGVALPIVFLEIFGMGLRIAFWLLIVLPVIRFALFFIGLPVYIVIRGIKEKTLPNL